MGETGKERGKKVRILFSDPNTREELERLLARVIAGKLWEGEPFQNPSERIADGRDAKGERG